MSQPTDITQPIVTIDPESTHEMPILPPTTAQAVAVVQQPAFDPARAHVLHTHTVLGRIMRTASLPTPVMWEGHQFSRPSLSLYLDSDLEQKGVKAYQGVFGGELTSEQRTSSVSEDVAQLDTLSTVIDGLDVTVMCWSYLPQAPAAEPEPSAAAEVEPEPQHDTAPAPRPETPVEHPEAA
jgi:hypothetical protein